ncbi:immunoglobulin-like domain-containing protein [Alkalithermobacter paradoxus]|uniref:Bacterial Ig-like domain-containing protein n=1 Tax=Alkalithermobacter paradoxus TaxID=29349 RepID=A0A1V4I8J9_9FIRM|nr:hypothetical protein CLOTH_06570 [[Clostridium] thermoalcaliphilum]
MDKKINKSLNDNLDNITVSQELKSKTLEKINSLEEKSPRKFNRFTYAAAIGIVCVSVIGLSLQNSPKDNLMDQKIAIQGESDIYQSKDLAQISREINIDLINDIKYDKSTGILSFTIDNNTGSDLFFGVGFHIEKYENGNWKKTNLTDDLAFIEIALIAQQGQKLENSIDLSMIKEKITSGKYRVVRSYGSDTQRIISYIEFEADKGGNFTNFNSYGTVEYIDNTDTVQLNDIHLVNDEIGKLFSVYSSNNSYSLTMSSAQGLQICPMYMGEEEVGFSMEADYGRLFEVEINFPENYDKSIISPPESSVSSKDYIEGWSKPGYAGDTAIAMPYSGARVISLNGKKVDADPGLIYWIPESETNKDTVKVKITVTNIKTNKVIEEFYAVINGKDGIYSLDHLTR